MSESTLTNLDGIPQYASVDTHHYHTPMIHPTNVDDTSKSMTIIVQNPFDDPSNNMKYLHDSSLQHQVSDNLSLSTNNMSTSHNIMPHSVRFNQELLNTFNINIPISRQTEPSSPNPTSITSLIPLPSPLSNNLGVNIHQSNQASLTPTIIGTYPTYQPSSHNNFDNYHSNPTGIYMNNPRPIHSKVNPHNGTAPIILRYPTMVQTQQYGHQMMKPRMISPNTYGTILPQQSPIIYDPSILYRTDGQQSHHVPPDDNILKSLLQINSQVSSEPALKPQSTPNGHDQSFNPILKARRKRKANDLNTSCENEVPTKSRKRKKKSTEEAEKFVEYSLQQLRDLPMLTPVEPLIDISNELFLSSSVNIIDIKKSKFQGEFGDIFIDNVQDHYRPYRRAPLISSTKSLSTVERRYRLCSNLLDRPPCLPSPPLVVNSSEKLYELIQDKNDLRDDESIISTSTIADNEDLINDIQTENIHLLKALSTSYDTDLRSLSPLLVSNENQSDQIIVNSSSNENEIEKNDQAFVEDTEKVSVTLTLTTEAANNVQSVIAAVADLLKIAYPTTFDVHQTLNNNNNNNNCTCSSTINNSNQNNNNNFLSLSSHLPITTLNRASSIYKIGRETNVNIQSLIDTQPKICPNCLQNSITEFFLKKRLNELPLNLREITPNYEQFVYFCNEQCFNTYITSTYQPPIAPVSIKKEPMDIAIPKYLPCKRQEEQVNELKDIKRWKRWDSNLLTTTFIQPSNTNEINELIANIKIPLTLNTKEDKRHCAFCNGIGDMTTNGPGRLLNLDVGQWCHLNCAFWSYEVYETLSGALMCVEQAFMRSIYTECIICKQKGSSLTCFYPRCSNTYHFTCAMDNGCVFYKDKTVMCPMHASKTAANDQILEDKSVLRKVWINRDEIKQIQNYMNEEHEDKSYILRIGSLILHNIGQLLPHQLQSSVFHNRNFVYPVGYTITRFYWSMRNPNRRCAYICSIIDMDNKPMFRIRVHEDEQIEEFLESSAKAVWHKVINEIDSLRRNHGLVKIFPVFVNGEDLYGLTEPHIIRLIESLPGVEMLQNYAFKYGRLQLFDMPLTVNPTGCARSEPTLRTHFRRHAHPLTSSHSSRSAAQARNVPGAETTQIPYLKQFVLSKPTQYRKLKIEWRQNTYLAKSRIQGLGLFAARDLEKHTMVIEYIGELIRNEVANKREKLYEEHNRGIYMFRLDDDYVVDATMSGCLARYINHSCEPNSIAEVVQIEKDNKIIIITNRRISKGEELMYDYKFDFEDDSKIPCNCGAVNCRKWMN
ncbi:unnamed protein product [Adineta steineri]|uniref:Histone-lysine N-methyltransferase n=1 Tax=Adineta steineri TaxID=433720 RepID=A0A814ZZD9_9BILA|nr:unnamed protein product [Adineta steineri]CAF1532833.1 unnamed protein product [Adineta steineri]